MLQRILFRPLSYLVLALSVNALGQVRYPPDASTVVELKQGKLQGALPAMGVRAYLGVPYAAPPVGPLRWQPPRGLGRFATAGAAPRLAVAHGAPCPQQKFGWNDSLSDLGTEDCLFLNVWAPVGGSKHPVMIYIHGGSNTAGSAAEELSNGLDLVPRGVLLVTFDYRLGIFGFFRTPELDAESGYNGSGNYGLMDQIAALRWVHDNIGAFGGDPDNVTIFGESAGAVDTGLLMTSPLARGLFHRALEESGQIVGLMPTATQAESETAWSPVARALGPNLATMRSASTEDVLVAERNAPKPPPERFWGHRGASVDGHVLPLLPAQAFAQGKEAPVPLLLGVNVQEIVPASEEASAIHHLIEDAVGADAAPKLEAMYAETPANALEGPPGARFQTDRDFRGRGRLGARGHATHGFATFVYQFDRSPGSGGPAKHGSELRFVFGFPGAAMRGGAAHSRVTADDLAVSRQVQTFWTIFARGGRPGPASVWAAFDARNQSYLHFEAASVAPTIDKHLGGAPCSILAGDVLPGSH